MNINDKFPKNYRYERKFVSEVIDQRYGETFIRNHRKAFREIYKQRFVNNIYLDTPRLSFFFSNVEGHSNRKKLRIRWYGDLLGNIKKPVLEFKIKEGYLGNKISFPLSNFQLNRNFNSDYLVELFKTSDLPLWVIDEVMGLEPTLLNRYSRRYYLSFDKCFRITIDNDLEYYAISKRNNTLSNKHYEYRKIIIELKYESYFNDIADQVTSEIPLRITKSSKYINGIFLLNPNIPL